MSTALRSILPRDTRLLLKDFAAGAGLLLLLLAVLHLPAPF